ncbi:MAG: hypothetical protein ACE5K8_05045 [Candidatus Zixiibacteriota bacterium]
MNRVFAKGFWVLTIVVLLGTPVKASIELQSSVFNREGYKIKYASSLSSLAQRNPSADSSNLSLTSFEQPSTFSYKSPAKAFFLSLAVPGLGQFYYGSKVKPLVFLSAEVVSWVFYTKWHRDGDDLTNEYEAFNQAHWSRDRYENKYLWWTYNVTDDELINAQEITHHLPDDMNQQYYEMTGKYNQFAWGWDDAELDGRRLDDFNASDPPPAIKDSFTTPYSARRIQYEKMRDDANNKYDQATRMIFVSMANRLISAFEAYFVTRNRNNKTKGSGIDLTSFKIRASLKSYHARRDTPFFTVTCKF